jgi:hypothetical protein
MAVSDVVYKTRFDAAAPRDDAAGAKSKPGDGRRKPGGFGRLLMTAAIPRRAAASRRVKRVRVRGKRLSANRIDTKTQLWA